MTEQITTTDTSYDSKQYQLAKKNVIEMPSGRRKVKAVITLAKWARTAAPDDAFGLLKKARDDTKALKRGNVDTLFLELTEAWVKFDVREKALECARDIRNPARRCHALFAILKGFSRIDAPLLATRDEAAIIAISVPAEDADALLEVFFDDDLWPGIIRAFDLVGAKADATACALLLRYVNEALVDGKISADDSRVFLLVRRAYQVLLKTKGNDALFVAAIDEIAMIATQFSLLEFLDLIVADCDMVTEDPAKAACVLRLASQAFLGRGDILLDAINSRMASAESISQVLLGPWTTACLARGRDHWVIELYLAYAERRELTKARAIVDACGAWAVRHAFVNIPPNVLKICQHFIRFEAEDQPSVVAISVSLMLYQAGRPREARELLAKASTKILSR